LGVPTRSAVLGLLVGVAAVSTAKADIAAAPGEAAVDQLRGLSIEDLAKVSVTTVSRREESLAQAPAAAYVITRDEILRSGASSVPEMLRLAPNLFVARTSASTWTITARGQSGNAADQAFSNKLLVLIDGRSVYTPLFSGVYWDMQDLIPEDIERIEVISGPGATLWGANAFSGVINIITRKSSDTQGLLAEAGGGNLDSAAGVRYGGRLGEGATYRIYARGFRAGDTETRSGASAHDAWSRIQGGFRFDWTPSERDEVSIHGDAFNGTADNFDSMSGGNVVARWSHAADNGSTLQVQAYVDREQRGHDTTGGTPLWVNTYDLDLQHSFSLGERNAIVWGGGLRRSEYHIEGTPSLQVAPARGDLNLSNLFVQDTLTVTPSLRLILGLKFEDDPYSGWSPLPDVRLSWTPNASTLVWAAASRSIRAPTPFDRDVLEFVGPTKFLTGGANFENEKLTAYELGARIQPTPRTSFSISAYYNVYDDLRSVEVTPVTFLPISWGNGVKGKSHGLEAWGNYQAASWWRLSASVNLLSEDFKFKRGASGILGVSQVGDDPRQQAQLKSSMDLGPSVTWDADLRYVSQLPDPRVPAYGELNTRVAWRVTDRIELAVSGFNLLHDRHQEFPAPNATAVPRSVFVGLRWGF